MFEILEMNRMAQGLAAHAAARMGLVAQNVAQADTPGYQALDLPPFAESYRQGLAGRSEDLPDRRLRAQPDRLTADPNGNGVSLEREMVKAASLRQQHDMALAVYRSSTDILRASLGRMR